VTSHPEFVQRRKHIDRKLFLLDSPFLRLASVSPCKLVLRSRSLKRVSGQMGGGGRQPRKPCGASNMVPPSEGPRPRAKNGQGAAAPPLQARPLGTGWGLRMACATPRQVGSGGHLLGRYVL